jgi:hypothetical protein
VGKRYRQEHYYEDSLLKKSVTNNYIFFRNVIAYTNVMVFFSMFLGSGLALFSTFRKSDVLALIREWMYALELLLW